MKKCVLPGLKNVNVISTGFIRLVVYAVQKIISSITFDGELKFVLKNVSVCL